MLQKRLRSVQQLALHPASSVAKCQKGSNSMPQVTFATGKVGCMHLDPAGNGWEPGGLSLASQLPA